MPPLSSILMRSSYNFSELISFLRVHMSPYFIECPPSNGGSLLLAGTTVKRSWDFGESILSSEELKNLIGQRVQNFGAI